MKIVCDELKKKNKRILVTGGAGYVGSALVPTLIAAGYKVNVLDLYLYGDNFFEPYRGSDALREIKGDIRDIDDVSDALNGCGSVIHLACISNDPSYDLDPKLGQSINYDAFRPLVKASKKAGIKRFIYASSSSVYGIKNEPEVTEEISLEPLTDYSKYKALCESVLAEEREEGFVTCIVRPSTICGYAPRQRLDVIVNILTNHAIKNRKIRVFGGDQKRPNLHIKDMVDLYLLLLEKEESSIDGKTFNVGCDNFTVNELAEIVRSTVSQSYGVGIDVVKEPTNDNRSYHVSSKKIQKELGFQTNFTIQDAVLDLIDAFTDGRLSNTMTDSRYFNVRTMQEKQIN